MKTLDEMTKWIGILTPFGNKRGIEGMTVMLGAVMFSYSKASFLGLKRGMKSPGAFIDLIPPHRISCQRTSKKS